MRLTAWLAVREETLHSSRATQDTVQRNSKGASQRTQRSRFEASTYVVNVPFMLLIVRVPDRSSQLCLSWWVLLRSWHVPEVYIVACTGPCAPEYSACVLPTIISTFPLTFVVVVLAVQNMEASGLVTKAQEIEFMALGGSLVMMSKGLLSCDPWILPDPLL